MQLATMTAHLMDMLPFGGPHGPGAAGPSGPNVAAIVSLLLSWVLIAVLPAVLVLITALKRGANPWLWTILALIPGVGWITAPLFFFLTLLSMLDRLQALEARAPAAGAPAPTWES